MKHRINGRTYSNFKVLFNDEQTIFDFMLFNLNIEMKKRYPKNEFKEVTSNDV